MLSVNTQERKPTDVPAFYFCIAFVLIILGGFVGYAFFNGSIYRIINGIDDCGNVCGMKNDKNTLDFCGTNDKQSLPLTLVNITKSAMNPNITYSHSKCVQRCSDFPGYIELANRCFFVNGSDSSQAEVGSVINAISSDLLNSWSAILISSIVALVFSIILLVLFRYAIKYVIWIIFIGLTVSFVIAAVVMLVLYFTTKEDAKKKGYSPEALLISSGVFALIAVILALVIFCFRKRIRLVIQLFKEASKALGDVPLIVAEPLLSFLAFVFSCVAFLYFTIIIESSGNLEVQNSAKGKFLRATYTKDFGMVAAYYVNLVAFIWFIQFILGCQHFIIAGTVGQWFFARTKSKLNSPIRRSFDHLYRFHIGSICLGSIFITIVKIIRMIVHGIKSSLKDSSNTFAKVVACCCDFLVEQMERFLQYLVRNAYIVVALEGTPLIKSGKKAFKLITENLTDVIALNQVGDLVLFMGQLFVTLIAGFVTYEFVSRNDAIQLKFIPIILSVIFAFLIAHCFISVYEMTVDTIFICFCIDCEQNDGTSRPYFMSRKLMEVMLEFKGAAGGEFTNFGAFKHGDASSNAHVEAGAIRPMIPPNYQFSQ